MKPLSNERGLALLSALLSVALLTLIVVEMTDATLVHTHLARNAGNAMAAQLLARSAEVGGEALLIEDKSQNPRVTANNGLWAFPFPPLPVGPGTIGLTIKDEGGKLDLNQVRDARQREALENLFASLDLPPTLLDSIESWTSSPEQAAAAGVAGAAECALAIPCEPPYAQLRSVDDLRLIIGFDERTIALLQPYVTAHSGAPVAGVNVNTAPPLVLRALGCEVQDDYAAPLEGYENIAAFKEDVSCEEVNDNLLRIASDVFAITAVGEVGDATQTVRSIVKRSASKAERLTWQERPVFDLPPDTVR